MKWRTLEVPTKRLFESSKPNSNVMPQEDLDRLTANMRDKGCLQPILVRGDLPPPLPKDPLHPTPAELVAESSWLLSDDKLEVVDGSHRLAAAKAAGLPTVPVTVIDVTDAQAAALRIGMNRLRGDLDLAAVGNTLAELEAAGTEFSDLALCGYGGTEIDDLISAVQHSDLELDAMAGLGQTPEAPPPETKARRYLLELSFTDRKIRDRAKKFLMNTGSGDLTEGLKILLVEAGEDFE